jgi:hypothetical protein
MLYTIYKITNKINGKVYIGKHQTTDLEDDYMGSGKLLRRAQEKYGIENFEKQILHAFDSEEEMNSKEKELVTEEFCLLEHTYNLCEGGKGGFGYINSIGLNGTYEGRIKSLETIKHNLGVSNVSLLPKVREKMNPKMKRISSLGVASLKEKYPNGTFQGKKHKEETKRKIAEKVAVSQFGSKNSQFGTIWITNETLNKKIKSSDTIPLGWRRGKVVK